MKPYSYFLLAFAISCTSSTVKQEGQVSDSLAAFADTSRMEEMTMTEETSTYEDESETIAETEAPVDSSWLREFAGRPLGMSPYEYLKSLLEDKGVEFNNSIVDGEMDIVFGNSIISILKTEAYGDVVCSANIDTPLIPLDKDVTIGMPREDFLSMAGIQASALIEGSGNKEYVEFSLYYEDDTSTRTTFWLDDKSLIRVEYVFSPCIMYD